MIALDVQGPGAMRGVRGVVDAAALPEYPLGRDDRLDGMSFVKWHYHRWMGSRSFKLMSWEAQGMARALFDMALHESPVGTLPADAAELAVMLRCTAQRIDDLRKMEFGPLRNWQPCLCSGEVRLFHPVVLEVVQDALTRRDIAQLSKADRAVAMRQNRLAEALVRLGCCKSVCEDRLLIERMDQWMAENHRGNRTMTAYARALDHAARERWIDGGMIAGGAGTVLGQRRG